MAELEHSDDEQVKLDAEDQRAVELGRFHDALVAVIKDVLVDRNGPVHLILFNARWNIPTKAGPFAEVSENGYFLRVYYGEYWERLIEYVKEDFLNDVRSEVEPYRCVAATTNPQIE